MRAEYLIDALCVACLLSAARANGMKVMNNIFGLAVVWIDFMCDFRCLDKPSYVTAAPLRVDTS